MVARKIVANTVAGVSEVVLIATGLLEPLRAYPRWLVLLCVAIVLGGVLALAAKPLKWVLYLVLVGVFAVFMAAFAWWLAR